MSAGPSSGFVQAMRNNGAPWQPTRRRRFTSALRTALPERVAVVLAQFVTEPAPQRNPAEVGAGTGHDDECKVDGPSTLPRPVDVAEVQQGRQLVANQRAPGPVGAADHAV